MSPSVSINDANINELIGITSSSSSDQHINELTRQRGTVLRGFSRDYFDFIFTLFSSFFLIFISTDQNVSQFLCFFSSFSLKKRRQHKIFSFLFINKPFFFIKREDFQRTSETVFPLACSESTLGKFSLESFSLSFRDQC